MPHTQARLKQTKTNEQFSKDKIKLIDRGEGILIHIGIFQSSSEIESAYNSTCSCADKVYMNKPQGARKFTAG